MDHKEIQNGCSHRAAMAFCFFDIILLFAALILMFIYSMYLNGS